VLVWLVELQFLQQWGRQAKEEQLPVSRCWVSIWCLGGAIRNTQNEMSWTATWDRARWM